MQMKEFPGKSTETTTAAVLAVGQGEGREGKVQGRTYKTIWNHAKEPHRLEN